MIIITIAMTVLLLLLVNKIIKTQLERVMILSFIVLWSVILCLSQCNPLNLFPVSSETYLIIHFYVFSLSLGFLSVPSKNQLNEGYKKVNYKKFLDDIISNKWYTIALIVADIALFSIYKIRAMFLDLYSIAELRQGAIEEIFEGTAIGLPYNMIISPLVYLVSFLLCYSLIYSRKGHWIQIILMFLYIILLATINNGRTELLTLCIFCIFLFLIKSLFISQKSNGKSLLLSVSVIVVVVIIVTSFMTIQRASIEKQEFNIESVSDGVEEMSNQFSVYLLGPIRALDYALNNDYVETTGGYHYGLATLGFADNFVALVLNNCGISYTAQVKQLTQLVQNKWIYVGTENSFNFAYTAVLFHYSDLGVLGVILLPFLFGRIVRRITIRFISTGNPAVLVATSYMYFIMIYSFFSWGLYRHPSFVYVCILLVSAKLMKTKLYKYHI